MNTKTTLALSLNAQTQNLAHGALPLYVASQWVQQKQPLLIVTAEPQRAASLADEIQFYLDGTATPRIYHLPDWETLPYDRFSPHQDITSMRIRTLSTVATHEYDILVCAMPTFLQRLPPAEYFKQHVFLLRVKQRHDREQLRKRLIENGYRHVQQVFEHGEFAMRGALIDLFPMGHDEPWRIEFDDDEIASLRSFDPETQRSKVNYDVIDLLPAREFPFDEESISNFKQRWRDRFEVLPRLCPVYTQVSEGFLAPGLEYYIPLFFENTATLADYITPTTTILLPKHYQSLLNQFNHEVQERFEQYRFDQTHPLLPPDSLFLTQSDLTHIEKNNHVRYIELLTQQQLKSNLETFPLPLFNTQGQRASMDQLQHFISQNSSAKILFTAKTVGRAQIFNELLQQNSIKVLTISSWHEFITGHAKYALCVAALDFGFMNMQENYCVIPEDELYGGTLVRPSIKRTRKGIDPDTLIKNLAELQIGAPVVHLDHGVGRYLGLQTLTIDEQPGEFLAITYADDAKLYVPVQNLHLISRFIGPSETAPLHHLGTEQWNKAKQKALEKARDAAAQLLEIYAKRSHIKGFACQLPTQDYQNFSQGFPFAETQDQAEAIQAVINDMCNEKVMDRLICGDVGFGKTEVAMRASFIAVHNHRQVVVLVPTTLLAQQHYDNFRERFAAWPVNIEMLSRFRTKQEQTISKENACVGKVDILIGTHQLLNKDLKLPRLGLIIIDEEHRFGVSQKEQLKKLKAAVDVLTLTATPIPRTLNMALAGLRDLSLITTPPPGRLAIKTFLVQKGKAIIREAVLREILRGGQVFYLHNDVATINRAADELMKLIPEAKIAIAHGQMRERDLENVMNQFYHLRFNLLICSTIIETGIDIPTANTILIERADRFGLAQLHQLRGRVGRSHHQAYAYLMVPPEGEVTGDAKKRLEAITSLEELGAGFMLANHDMEIRGAGEFLGEEQSGQMQAVGFNLYMELLEKAIQSLQQNQLDFEITSTDHLSDIDLKIPAFIPEDYVNDVHERLILYKRLASIANEYELTDLRVELIDRFGSPPAVTTNLLQLTATKLKANQLGAKKIDLTTKAIRVEFTSQPKVAAEKIINLLQTQPKNYQLDGSTRIRIILPGETIDTAMKFSLFDNFYDALINTQ